jgi:hypothetical protein
MDTVVNNVETTNIEELVFTGKICPYCGKPTQLVDSSVVYRKSYGKIYMCTPCNSWVGTHKDTDVALGRLANRELRHWKKLAHSYFDPISKTNLINRIWNEFIPETSNRNKAYLWLSKEMGMDRAKCHIGMFGLEQCKQVVEICKKYIP